MENNNTNSRVTHYLELYEEVRDRVGDDQIALGIMHELAKDARMCQIVAERQTARDQPTSGDQPATEKQLGYLGRLGVAISKSLTKREASELIDQAHEQAPIQLSRRVP